MYVSVNNKGEIKNVGVASDPNLTSLYINDKTSPFIGWSEAKICCYKVDVKDGIVMMMTPYVDSRLLDHFNQVGLDTETNSTDIVETQIGLADTFEAMTYNQEDILQCEEAIAELYEIIIGG